MTIIIVVLKPKINSHSNSAIIKNCPNIEIKVKIPIGIPLSIPLHHGGMGSTGGAPYKLYSIQDYLQNAGSNQQTAADTNLHINSVIWFPETSKKMIIVSRRVACATLGGICKRSWLLLTQTLALLSSSFSMHCFLPTSGASRKVLFSMPHYFDPTRRNIEEGKKSFLQAAFYHSCLDQT